MKEAIDLFIFLQSAVFYVLVYNRKLSRKILFIFNHRVFNFYIRVNESNSF